VIILVRNMHVVHSTAHHAISGLSYIHPHLGKACFAVDSTEGLVNLLAEEIEPVSLITTKELGSSSAVLRTKFSELLESEGVSKEIIKSASITFYFKRDFWPVSCYLKVVTAQSKVVEVTLGSDWQ